MEKPTIRPPASEARKVLRQAVTKAAATLVKLLDAEDPKLQLKAAEAILSRAGITEADRMSHNEAESTVGASLVPSIAD